MSQPLGNTLPSEVVIGNRVEDNNGISRYQYSAVLMYLRVLRAMKLGLFNLLLRRNRNNNDGDDEEVISERKQSRKSCFTLHDQ